MRENGLFINHIMGCSLCKPRGNLYCTKGHTLRLRSNAEFISTLERLEDRRRWLATMREQFPNDIHTLEQLVMEMFEAACKQKNVRIVGGGA